MACAAFPQTVLVVRGSNVVSSGLYGCLLETFATTAQVRVDVGGIAVRQVPSAYKLLTVGAVRAEQQAFAHRQSAKPRQTDATRVDILPRVATSPRQRRIATLA